MKAKRSRKATTSVESGGLMALWQSLAAAGGVLALVFIVGLVIALAVMTTVFLGSAVVVLERFSRVPRSLPATVGFGASPASAPGICMPSS